MIRTYLSDAAVHIAVVLAVALLAAFPAWAVHKCTGPDGKVV